MAETMANLEKFHSKWQHIATLSGTGNTQNIDTTQYDELCLVSHVKVNASDTGYNLCPVIIPTDALSGTAEQYVTGYASGPSGSWGVAYSRCDVSNTSVGFIQAYFNSNDVGQYCNVKIYAR